MGRRLALLIAAVALSSCGRSRTSVTIGSVVSLVGSLSDSGTGSLQAAQLAVDEINAAGGVLGGNIALATREDHSDPMTISGIGHDLVNNVKVPAMFCCDGSGLTIPMASLTVPAHVVQISGASTSPAISMLASDGYVFRTCPSDALQGQLIAERAFAKGYKKAAVTYLPNPYGMGLANAFATNFTKLGGTVTFNQAYTEGQSSYSDLLTQIYATTPETIVLVAYPLDGAQVIRDYLSGFVSRQTFWFFPDALAVSAFVDGVGGANFSFQHEGTHSSTASGAGYMTYAHAYQAKYNAVDVPGTYSPNAYDAIYVLALAMVAAGAADGTAIRDNMRTVANSPGMTFGPGQFAAAAAALKAGMKINYDGASGPVDFDMYGDVAGTYDVWKVVNGQIQTVSSMLPP
jgi:ABC-type branched-subunit amino acid transport system substrate-binding protein